MTVAWRAVGAFVEISGINVWKKSTSIKFDVSLNAYSN